MLNYIQYYALDYIDFQSISFIAVLIVLLSAIGTIALYCIAKVFRTELTMKRGACISFYTGIGVFFVTAIETVLTYNGVVSDESLILPIVIAVAGIALGSYLLRRYVAVPWVKGAIMTITTMAITYAIGLLFLFGLAPYFFVS